MQSEEKPGWILASPHQEYDAGNDPTYRIASAKRCSFVEIWSKIGSTYRYRCCIYRHRRCPGRDGHGCGDSRGDSCDRGTRDRYYSCVDRACCQSFRDWNRYCRGLAGVSCQGHRASRCFRCLRKDNHQILIFTLCGADLLSLRLCRLVQ